MASYVEEKRDREFWAQVDRVGDLGCWAWIGYIDTSGYGRMFLHGKKYFAHRLSWEMHNGLIPDGLCVCHKCDNPKCVNPAHLFLATGAVNSHDMSIKGRSRKGKPNPAAAKLTPSDVEMIRACYPSYSIKDIAKKYKVAEGTIRSIIDGRTWSHVA